MFITLIIDMGNNVDGYSIVCKINHLVGYNNTNMFLNWHDNSIYQVHKYYNNIISHDTVTYKYCYQSNISQTYLKRSWLFIRFKKWFKVI